MTKLRVLALHGYGQNAHVFRTQIKQICGFCEDDVEFVFLDGPVVLHPPDQPTSSLVDDDGYPLPLREHVLDPEASPRGWCTFNEGKTRYNGLAGALKAVRDVLEVEKFDGIIGFSQGAALAAYICAYLEDPSAHPLFYPNPHPPFKFAILASGFAPVDPPLPHLLQTPTLHILGRHDTHIGRADSWPLVEACLSPRVEVHEGGHFVATKATWRRFFREWMCAFQPGSGVKPEEVRSPVPQPIREPVPCSIEAESAEPEAAPLPALPALLITPKWVVWTPVETAVM